MPGEFGSSRSVISSDDVVIYRRDISSYERIVRPALDLEEEQKNEVSIQILEMKIH